MKLREEIAEQPESLKCTSMWFNTYEALEYHKRNLRINCFNIWGFIPFVLFLWLNLLAWVKEFCPKLWKLIILQEFEKADHRIRFFKLQIEHQLNDAQFKRTLSAISSMIRQFDAYVDVIVDIYWTNIEHFLNIF